MEAYKMLKHVVLYVTTISICFIFTNVSFVIGQTKTSPSVDRFEGQTAVEPNQLTPDQLKRQEYELDVQRLRFFSPSVGAYKGSNRLDRFQQEADALLQKWLDKDIFYHQYLTVKILNILSSNSFGDWLRRDLMRVAYARRALAKSRELQVETPLETELELLMDILPDPEFTTGQLSGSAWAAHRSEKMVLMANGFKRLQSEIDEDHDFSEVLISNPPFPQIPPGFDETLIFGMAPSGIEDPKFRAEYEKLVAEHRRKGEERLKQDHLRRSRDRFSRVVTRYMVSAYLKPPHKTEEFETFLDTYIKDEKLRDTRRADFYEKLPQYWRYILRLQKQGQ